MKSVFIFQTSLLFSEFNSRILFCNDFHANPLTFQAVENDLKVAAKARKEVENQAQKMLAQGMETQVHTLYPQTSPHNN